MADIIVSSDALAVCLGKSATEVENLFLKDGEALPPNEAGKVLNSNVKSKIDGLIAKEKENFDVQGTRDRARKEVLTEVNKVLLSNGAEGDDWKAQIDSLLSKKGKSEMTESEIKNSDVFRTAVKELNEKYQTEVNAHTETKKGFSTRKNASKIRKFANDFLKDPKNGFAIPENEAIANKRLDNFIRDLQNGSDGSLKIVEGDFKALDSEGRTLQDDSYNDISATSFVEKVASSYYTKGGQQRKAPKLDDQGKPIVKTFTNPGITSEAQLQDHISKMASEGKTSSEIKTFVEDFETNVKPKITDWQ